MGFVSKLETPALMAFHFVVGSEEEVSITTGTVDNDGRKRILAVNSIPVVVGIR